MSSISSKPFGPSSDLTPDKGTDDDFQEVEGFEQIISGRKNHWGKKAKFPLTDFRGETSGWSTELWWEVNRFSETITNPNKQDLIWATATCPEKTSTVFSFAGKSSNMPPGSYHANQARLSVNNEEALTFDIGVKRPTLWEEGDFKLQFIPKSIQTPFEGYNREFEMPGVTGIYRLTVPTRQIEPGKHVTVKVNTLPPKNDYYTWYMVLGRRDVLKGMYVEEIGALQSDVLRLKTMVDILARKVYSDQLPCVLQTEHSVLLNRGMKWVGVPDILRLQNREILLMVREAAEHVSNDGIISTVRSRDEGRSWGDYNVAMSTPGLDHRDASVTQLRDGTLLMNWFPEIASDPWPTKIHVIRSSDNGHTWGNEVVIEPDPFWWIRTSEPCLELSNGRILMPIYTQTKDLDWLSVCFSSDDKGDTWKYLSTVTHLGKGDTTASGGGEPSIIDTESGKLIMISRTRLINHMLQGVSYDGGETWPEQLKVPVDGGNTQPSLMRLGDGKILLSYGNRGHPKGPQIGEEPYGVKAIISQDEGKTWGTPLTLRQDLPNMDIGYACSVELELGQILTAYWYSMFDVFSIGGTFWRVPDT